MLLELTHKKMAYLRDLLRKDTPKSNSVDEESHRDLLTQLQNLEDRYAAGLIA